VQSEMLKLIEGKNVPVTLFPGTPHEISVMMNTQNIRFIGGGTFSRLPPENIPTVQDFVNIGFSKELLGRFGKIIFFEGANEEKLLQILQSPFVSPIEDEKILLERKYNTKVNFTAKALQRIAKKASQLDTGVRGLSTVVEQTTESIITESSGQHQTITIDEKYVNDHVPEIVRKTPAWGALYGNF
jgi:ATP-dependent protease Clp ATPase subunit